MSMYANVSAWDPHDSALAAFLLGECACIQFSSLESVVSASVCSFFFLEFILILIF